MRVTILRDTDPVSLEEKINRVIAEAEAGMGELKGIAYQTTVIPQVRGDKVTGYKVEHSAIVTVDIVRLLKEA